MTTTRISHKDFWQAVGYIFLSALCLSGAAALGKSMASEAPLPMIIAIRFVGPLIILFVYASIKKTLIHCLRFSGWDMCRAFFVVGSQYALFYVLAHSNTMLATLLYATSGLFLPIITFSIYKTHIPRKTLAAIIISFIGVAMSLNILNNHLSMIDLIGLGSGLLAAGSSLIQHANSRRSKNIHHVLVMYLLASAISLFILLTLHPSHFTFHLNKLINSSMIVIAFFSILSIGNQTFKSLGFMKVNKAASLTPFLYLLIPLSGIIDWIVFHITPNAHMWIGTAVIMMGGFVMALRK